MFLKEYNLKSDMKPLSPSLKERKRYILFKIISKLKLEKENVSELVAKAGLQFLGELGMAKSGLQVLPETWRKDKGVIRIGHKYVNEAKATLAFVKEYKGEKIIITCLKVSGAVGKLKGG